MKHPWLTLLSFGFIGVLIFILFYIRLQPIEPVFPEETTTQNTLDQPSVTFVNPAKGAEDATVTIVEYGDFQCEGCKTIANNLNVALNTFPDQVRVVWKDFPNNSLHPVATDAAIAAHCAGQQGMFWPYHDELFARQVFLSESELVKIARDLELNMDAFADCVETKDTLPIVQKDFEEAQALEITATPTIFIGDERIVGSVSAEEIIRLIREKLGS